MRILYIADGRSPIANNWIRYFVQNGDEVHLVSTFPCQSIVGLASLVVIPVALSGFYGGADVRTGGSGKLLRQIVPVGLRTRIRQLAAPSTFSRATKSLSQVIERLQPDLIHAMRIPYEGMIAAMAMMQHKKVEGNKNKIPLLISVWGNDFTLHAKSTRIMDRYTRQTLFNCDGLHTDCVRDLHLAIEYGFPSNKPKIVLPGGGGVKLDIFNPAEVENGDNIIEAKPQITIINPRGFRAYVRNDTFFHAIPLVIKKYPHVRFLCPGMANESLAQKWIAEIGISEKVDLLPQQSQQEMAELFRKSEISLSITTHDGTPNTLLEAMACGSFPIAGDIESIREWLTPGKNGLLIDPGDPEALAEAILTAILNPDLRQQANTINRKLVEERAEYEKVMQSVKDFYQKLSE
jgi:glycosyltransferase involved in cell wall biosynthesis